MYLSQHNISNKYRAYISQIYRIDMPITLSNREFMSTFTGQIQFARNINQQQSLAAPHEEQQWAQVPVKL